VNVGTKNNFERLSDRFFRDVDEWFLHQHGIRHCRTTLDNREGLVSSRHCSCNHNMGNKKLFRKNRRK